MSLLFIIWLADIVTPFTVTLVIMSILIPVAVVIHFTSEEDKKLRKEGKRNEYLIIPGSLLLKIIIPLLMLAVILPSKEGIYLMTGTMVAEKVLADPRVTETGNKVFTLINKKLDAELERVGVKSAPAPTGPKPK